MKLSADTLNTFNLNLQKYKNEKSVWLDYSGRRATADGILIRIAELQDSDASEEEWIKFVLFLCKLAHGIQIPLGYCSKIVETLYRESDRLLCEIPSKNRADDIQRKIVELTEIKKTYHQKKNDSKQKETVLDLEKKIVKRLYQLAWLGEPRFLMRDTSMEEMKKHFPGSVSKKVKGWFGGEFDEITGYEYSNSQPYLPMALNRGPDNTIFRYHYNKKYREENKVVPRSGRKSVEGVPATEEIQPEWLQEILRETEPVQSEAVEYKDEPVTGMSVRPLTTLLAYYSKHKAFNIIDSDEKNKKCTAFIEELSRYEGQPTSLRTWLELVIRLGEAAYAAQDGAVKDISNFSQVLSVVRLELIAQLKLKAPDRWAALMNVELDAFTRLQEEASNQKWRSKDIQIIEAIEKKQKMQFYRLAYLEQKDFLLSRRLDEIEARFLKRKKGAYSGYPYPDEAQPKGLTGNDKLCIYLPTWLQSEFTLIWRHEHAEGLKSMKAPETAAEDVGASMAELEEKINLLDRDEKIQKCVKHQDRDAGALAALSIDSDWVKQVQSQITEFSSTSLRIAVSLGALTINKTSLHGQLTKLTQRIDGFSRAIKTVGDTLQRAKDEEIQKNKKAEEEHAALARQGIAEFLRTVSSFRVNYKNILDAENETASDLKENHIDPTGLQTDISDLESGQLLKDIQKHIGGSGNDEALILQGSDLKPHLAELDKMKKTAAKIAATLKGIQLEPVLSSSQTPESKVEPVEATQTTEHVLDDKNDAVVAQLSASQESSSSTSEEETSPAFVNSNAQINALLPSRPVPLVSVSRKESDEKAAPKKVNYPEGITKRSELFLKYYDVIKSKKEKGAQFKEWQVQSKKDNGLIQRMIDAVNQSSIPVRSRSPSPSHGAE